MFDNFETVENPTDVFNWIDAHVRPPNKVLITTRMRTFVGDYHIDIGGMEDDEAMVLVNQHATHLGVTALLTPAYKRELIAEAAGHPYVIKVLLGDVAKERRAVNPRRVVASRGGMLRALFERTFLSLSPGGQRVFLLLSSWRVSVPEVAVEAVSLRPRTERFDVVHALEELDRYSLVDRVVNDGGEAFVSVPLAAAEYGKSKLNVSRFKVAISHDLKLLRDFGAGRPGRRSDAEHGVYPRVENLFKAVATRASDDPNVLSDELPVLEFLASKVPRAYLRLAELVLETDAAEESRSRAKEYIGRFLASAPVTGRRAAWLQLADLCQASGDVLGEIHALSESALLPTVDLDDIGRIVTRLNARLRTLKGQNSEEARSGGVRELIESVIEAMEKRMDELTAINCSGLAWLHLNLGQADRALQITRHGLSVDPDNEYCLNLYAKLS